MPPDIEERLRELELAMPDDLDARLREVEKHTNLIPDLKQQISAMQNTLNTFVNDSKDRNEHMLGVFQRLATLESEHAKCFKTAGSGKEFLTQIGEWAIKIAAIGGLAYAAKEGLLK